MHKGAFEDTKVLKNEKHKSTHAGNATKNHHNGTRSLEEMTPISTLSYLRKI